VLHLREAGLKKIPYRRVKKSKRYKRPENDRRKDQDKIGWNLLSFPSRTIFEAQDAEGKDISAYVRRHGKNYIRAD
jgi:hypothetical protein